MENNSENNQQSLNETQQTPVETSEIIPEETIQIGEISQTQKDDTTPIITPTETNPAKENIQINFKINKKTIIIVVAVIAIAVIAFFIKGLVISATVNWSPISRYSVIRELEKIYGKSILNSLITQKLINSEANKKRIIISDEDINAELADIEKQLGTQGQTLDQVLKLEGMTMEELKEQIINRKKMEKLVADKIQVTDSELEEYIKTHKITIPKGQETEYTKQLKDQLKQQKLNEAANALIETLKSQSSIRYFANY